VVLLNLSEGELVGNAYVADTQWGLNVYKDDRLLVVGAQKAPGRTDTDFAVVRLSPEGMIDNGFGTNGVTLLDIAQQNATPKGGRILDDESVVLCGYTRDADMIVTPVVYKLDSAGKFDPTFGAGGVFNQIVLASVSEAYDVVPQGTNFVTVGYGSNGGAETLDWLSLRLTGEGKLDPTYGQNGFTRVDMFGFNDNGRALVALSDNRLLLVGGGRPAADNVDAMVAVLKADGAVDETFAPKGTKQFDLGGAADMFWGAALSPDQKRAAVVGTKAVGMGPGNDDGVLLLLPVAN
jgi:uncharacterized delta-60 repeat protein